MSKNTVFALLAVVVIVALALAFPGQFVVVGVIAMAAVVAMLFAGAAVYAVFDFARTIYQKINGTYQGW